MSARARLGLGVGILAATLSMAGCATVPDPPDAVGDDYPGTCMPAEFSWPTDFLESLPGESSAVGGSIVGLRLEYVDSQWVWRLRSRDTQRDTFGEPVDNPSFGRESIVDVRTLETLATREAELTAAEQQTDGSGVYGAAQLSGEQWPSPLIIEMARVTEDGTSVWQITTCDTETNEHSVMTLD
ncbi:hypothetical protein [Microbacterium sp. CFBP9034]|uniref:hypothetical protein n=1 Tax=Microbacterium sp. CFBP9034 TaxID=3096540 RepID=UPI002A6AFD44|nr:hypothetical protein [Microbacterium sp. CFBP9034]MDY0910158.1 hypothetical protein [Microbacterium sp. CFBP9034]